MKQNLDLDRDLEVHDRRIQKFVDMALPVCLQVPRLKKHVSMIVRKGRLLAIGTNAFKGHPIASRLGYRFEEQHSELNALLRCPERDRLTLINVRYNRNGELRMARPCPICLPWCCALFNEIYYSCPDGKMRLLDTNVVSTHNYPVRNLLRTAV